jgi:hypothetical protein
MDNDFDLKRRLPFKLEAVEPHYVELKDAKGIKILGFNEDDCLAHDDQDYNLVALEEMVVAMNSTPQFAVLKNEFKKARPLVYLAAPYTHENPKIVEDRVALINYAAGFLMQKDVIVFSPISHSHPIAMATKLPTSWEYWREFDWAYLSHCHRVVVLTLEGWDTSVGVSAEIQYAKENGLDLFYLDMRENGDSVGGHNSYNFIYSNIPPIPKGSSRG